MLGDDVVRGALIGIVWEERWAIELREPRQPHHVVDLVVRVGRVEPARRFGLGLPRSGVLELIAELQRLVGGPPKPEGRR